MFVVDTNVLVYAVNADTPEHQRCRDLLDRWRSQPGAWYLTWGVCYEFLRVTTHRQFSNPLSAREATSVLQALFASPGLDMLIPGERHGAVLDAIALEVPALSGNVWHDVTTAALMREHGIRRIVTRDTDFHRFRFLEVVDPLVGMP